MDDISILGETLESAVERIHFACFDEKYINSVNAVANSRPGSSRFADRILAQEVVPGTPILLNMGKEKSAIASCTARSVAEDWFETDFINECMRVHSHGMGIGYDLDALSDPFDFMVTSNAVFERQHKEGSLRRPVGDLASLHWSHPQIEKFVDAKINDPSVNWFSNFSVKLDQDFFDRTPSKGHSEGLLEKVAYAAWTSGDPGLIFADRIGASMGGQAVPPYSTVAPCGETGLIDGDLCHFAYVNLSRFVGVDSSVNVEGLRDAVHDVVDFLDYALFWTYARSNYNYHMALLAERKRIAVGVCGYSDALEKARLRYGSEEALWLAEYLMFAINVFSKERSAQLASCKTDPSNSKQFKPKNLSLNSFVGEQAFGRAIEAIGSYGLKHSTTTAVPPSGRSARVIGASPSIEPYFDSNSTTIAIAPVDDQLNTVRAFLRHVDESVSKTVHLAVESTVDDVLDTFLLAREFGLKSISIYRDKCRPDQPFAMQSLS